MRTSSSTSGCRGRSRRSGSRTPCVKPDAGRGSTRSATSASTTTRSGPTDSRSSGGCSSATGRRSPRTGRSSAADPGCRSSPRCPPRLREDDALQFGRMGQQPAQRPSERAGVEDRIAARIHADAASRAQELERQLAEADRELAALTAELARVESSIIWQGVQGLRRRVYGRIGEDSRTARAISAALRGTAALTSRRSEPELPPSPPQPIAELPYFADPEVSLILPVHSQPELT